MKKTKINFFLLAVAFSGFILVSQNAYACTTDADCGSGSTCVMGSCAVYKNTSSSNASGGSPAAVDAPGYGNVAGPPSPPGYGDNNGPPSPTAKSNGQSCSASSDCQSGCCSFGSSFGSAVCQDASICSSVGNAVQNYSNNFDAPPAKAAAPANSGGWSLSSVSGFGLPGGSVMGIVSNILDWLLLMFGFIGIIGFIISGIMYMMAAGDEGTMEKAKSAMKWSIVGVVVGLAGVVVIQAVDFALRAYGGF